MIQIIKAAHGRITSRHGQDVGRGFLHRGIDQGHSNSTAYDLQIMAPADGWVTASGREGSYGLRFYIRHDDGTLSVLAHHSQQLVSAGARVTQGQIIAVMGNTGTKFVHSHQEYRDAHGNQLDPLAYLGSAVASSNMNLVEEDELTLEQWQKIDGMANTVSLIQYALEKQIKPATDQVNGIKMQVGEVANTLSLLDYLVKTYIKPQTDQINAIAVSVGIVQWALTDDAQGLRTLVGNLTTLVGKIDGGDLDSDALAAALAEALAPLTTGPSVEQIAAAVQDEQDKRDRERLES